MSDVVIELNGRVFRRNGEDGWQMGTVADHDIDITFGAESVWQWQMLAAALDEIERLRTPENVECLCQGFHTPFNGQCPLNTTPENVEEPT